MSQPLVELRDIRKTYADTVAVDTVNLSIDRGEFVVLLGPSGSGKTTILSMIGGFIEPTFGQVIIDGVDVTHVPPAKRPTVTVFQDYALFPHMSVATNVGFGLEMRKFDKPSRLRRVDQALAMVGLEGFGNRGIHQLSGGQRQRVALARAIAVEPTVLLLDEPLGALDLALRRQMQDELVGLQKQLGTTFVHVTHDQDEAMSIADSIVVMNRGRIEDRGAPDRVYLKPESLFSATFMGESNLLEARITAREGAMSKVSTVLGELTIPNAGSVGDTLQLSIRPEQLRLQASEDCLSLGNIRIKELVFQGTNRRCHGVSESAPEVNLLMRVPVDQSIPVDDSVEVFVRRSDVVAVRA